MESAHSRLRDRAEKLRSQLDTLKKEISVANAFLQEILDRNVGVVEELESVTVTQIYLQEYTKVQKFLLKHINFVTEVNCNLEILTSNDLPMLNCLSGPQYSVEHSLHENSSDDNQVFQFIGDKKVSNLDYQDKASTLNNINEKPEVTKTLVLENKIVELKEVENVKSDVQSSKKKVLDPDTWTEAPEFVPKQTSEVKAAEKNNLNVTATPTVSGNQNLTSPPPVSSFQNVTTASTVSSFQNVPTVSSPGAFTLPRTVIPAVSASPLYAVQPQPNPYQYPIFYPRFQGAVQASPPGFPSPTFVQSMPPNTTATLSWNNPYTPKPSIAVTRNPIKIEAPPKPKDDKAKTQKLDQKSQPVTVPDVKNQLTKTAPEIKNEPVKNEIVIDKKKAEQVSENVEEKERNEEKMLEKRDKVMESKPVDILSEKKFVNNADDNIKDSAEPIPEMKISREPGAKYQVAFCHMVSPGEFYVQVLCPELSSMREMTKELEGYFKNEKVPVRDYQSKTMKNSEKKSLAKKQINRYGLSYTVDDPSWARVDVVDWRLDKDDDVVSVFFIDYGDTKDISLSYVQPMVPKFRKYPKFAQQCHLAEIYPADTEEGDSEDSSVKWSDQAITMFEILLESMSHDFSCQIVVCKHDGRYDEKSLPVKFFASEDGNCVNDKLVEFEYAVEAEKSPSEPNNLEKETVGALKAAASEPLKPGEVIGIQVTCLVKLNKFYCIREYGENEENELQKLVSYMNKPENVQDMLTLTEPPAVNQLVIGKYEADNLWYRARVIKTEPSLDRYKLFFLDYGNTQTVNFENIKKMERKFLNFPIQLIECYLSGVELLDDGKSEKAMGYFYGKVEDGEMSIKIVSCKSEVANSYEVVLYDKAGQDIGADLVLKNFVKKT